MRGVEGRFFLLLLGAASVGFALLLLPYFGAILWAVVAGIMFAPIQESFERAFPNNRNMAALIVLLIIIAMVILPASVISVQLVEQGSGLYAQIQSGQIDVGGQFERIQRMMPDWMTEGLRRLGLYDAQSLQAKLEATIASSAQTIATRLLDFGQQAFGVFVAVSVMLYLTFFLLRDGRHLARRVEEAIPLDVHRRRSLLAKFTAVVRATIKGSMVVAIVQGLIGGAIFWFIGIPAPVLWGVSMAFLSLLPAVGTGLVWVPVAIYLLATGAVWEGAVLVFCGVFVIGMVDNVLRPILVGRDTRMPDYVVLISTLGGLEVFGFNGFVIGPVIAALFIAVWEIFADARARPLAGSD